MLVYANHLSVQGAGAEEAVFKAIGGWLKEQMGYGLHPDQLRQDGRKYEGQRGEQRSQLQIRSCYEGDPALCAWVLKHSDNVVHGRQWIVEVGVKKLERTLEVSCIVKTGERSALVSSPVSASQPRVIRYLTNNVRATKAASFTGVVLGGKCKTVGQDSDSYRALLVEIERRDREGAIVLVSATRGGEYLVDPAKLQRTLFGLAQVVRIQLESDSHEMTQILGKDWSAWDGAVNVLAAPSPSHVRFRYFLHDIIQDWGSEPQRISQILAQVTANTNIVKLRKHVRPEGVMQLSMRRRLEKIHETSAQMNEVQLRQELSDALNRVAEQDRAFDEFAEENASLVSDLSRCKEDLREAHDDLRAKDYTIQSMSNASSSSGCNGSNGFIYLERLLKFATHKEEPSPLECLKIIEELYGDRCTILDDARSSASKMIQFDHKRVLLDLLIRLVTEYRDKLMSGKGDSEARKVFGRNDYAAMESKGLKANPKLRRLRTFDYRGKKVEMFKHLKIGVKDDLTQTIRVHFFWDADLKKIVIGYCGKHLPLK